MYVERKKSDSRRVRETKQKLQDALWELLKEKPIERIYVGEVAERAQLNRTSFYRYYMDVYDLYDSIVQQFAEMFQQKIFAILPELLFHVPYSGDNELTRFIAENPEVLSRLTRDSRILNRLKAENFAYAKRLLKIETDDASIDFIMEFYVGGQMALFSYWLQHQDQMTHEKFFALMQEMILRGPLTILKEKLSPEVLQLLQEKHGAE